VAKKKIEKRTKQQKKGAGERESEKTNVNKGALTDLRAKVSTHPSDRLLRKYGKRVGEKLEKRKKNISKGWRIVKRRKSERS